MPPLPFLENQPDLADHLEFEWNAFRDLSTDRQQSFGIGPIPWTSLDRYAVRHGIEDPDAFDRFRQLMQAMDSAYREHVKSLNPPQGNK